MSLNNNYARILTGSCQIKEHKAFSFSTGSDDFQRHCYTSIDNNQNVLVTAHTGCGKTRGGIYAMAKYIRDGKKVVYTTPIKALSNQKYKEFNEEFVPMFLEQSGIQATIGIMTGDIKINPDADCVIMTTEILRNSLYKIGKEGKTRKESELKDNFVSQIGCVIFDEAHYINDRDRGGVWEETIVLLDPSITLVMLSATLDDAFQFTKKIGNMKKKMTNLIPTSHRVVPLEHYVFVNNELIHIIDNNYSFNRINYEQAYYLYNKEEKMRKRKSNFSKISVMVDYLHKKNMLQCIFFSFSRRNCEKFANMITRTLLTDKESKEIDIIFKKMMHPYEKKYSHLNQYHNIKRLIYNGVAFHHSGLIHILKEIIEILFQKGLIKVLFATETFAIGVNMPTKTVVFTGCRKPTKEGRRLLLPAEYKQMSGRAGRRGKDKTGTVIVLPVYNLPTKTEMSSIVLGKVPGITSKLNIGYSFLLKNITSDDTSIKDFLQDSLYHSDTVLMINKLENNLKILENDIQEIDITDLSDDYKEYYDLENNINLTDNMFFVKSDNKREKQLKSKLLLDTNFEENYKKYCLFRNTENKINDTRTKINNYKGYIEEGSTPFINLMKHFNYVKDSDKQILELNSSDITVKGILASQINECNQFLLTEMLVRGMFNDLTPIEIASLVSIFIDDFRPEDRFYINDVEGTDKIHNRLNKINSIIDEYKSAEQSFGVISNIDWNIYYDYIDAIYSWASGDDIRSVLDFLEIDEGNFIRSVLKINNIVKDLICLSKISSTITSIPNLNEVEELIIRDIITLDSLYIND